MSVIENKQNTYSSIFKSTFLFGFVQVFNILAKVGINKAVAYFLGASGMGLISLFQSTVNILKTVFEFGISQSAVRDISEANLTSESSLLRTISLTKRIILLTASLGAIFTLIFSKSLSLYTFDSEDKIIAFRWLSIVVFFNILAEGQLGILKGMRKLRHLAYASLFGTIIGLIVGVPLYFFFSFDGIVPSMIVTSIVSAIFSYYYTSKIKSKSYDISLSTIINEGGGMIKMGAALMYVNLLVVLSEYFIRIYINNESSIEFVGYFQAGAMIINSYFGIVITALTTDYYPRISAINKDNTLLEIEFNKQSEVGLILMAPLVVIFLLFVNLIVKILYVESFTVIIPYLEYAAFSVLFLVCSNALGMILLAKQKSKIFFLSSTCGRVIIVIISIVFYKYFGLKGLGIATVLTAIFHLVFMQCILYFNFKIRVKKRLLEILSLNLLMGVLALLVRGIDNILIYTLLGVVLCSFSLSYSIFQIKRIANIDLLAILKRNLNKIFKL